MNPYEVLEIDDGADAGEVRHAYLEAVRRHPPDRDPEGFQRVREAYETLRDPGKRSEIELFGTSGLKSLGDLTRTLSSEKKRVGPTPWLRALEG